jgi:uncharacterized protein (TIGR03435 family)
MVRRVAVLSAMLSCLLIGQSSLPKFEVASIRPATPLEADSRKADRRGGPGSPDPGTFTCRNCPIFWILSEAYELHTYDYVAPEWLHTNRFDFAAKAPLDATKDDFRKMLQDLLVDRFKLAVHRESRQMSLYELTVGPDDPKLAVASPTVATEDTGGYKPFESDAEGFPILPRSTSYALRRGRGRARSQNEPISWFVEFLGNQLLVPVVDRTGLTERYDFLLSWAFEVVPGPTTADNHRSALIDATRHQLGLRLQRKKGQAEVLVVDHIEKTPTEN